MTNKFKPIFLLLLVTLNCSCNAINPDNIYIRVNQAGFLPSDLKTAVIFSQKALHNKEFSIKNTASGSIVLDGVVSDSGFTYGEYKHCYTINFTKLKSKGTYIIEADGQKSYKFSIDQNVYTPVVDSLLLFFQVQRCGPTNPYMHKVCHLYDVSGVKGYDENAVVDLTGGWHDAGDYVKFLSTTAFTTYMMLFSYEFEKDKFEFDNNHNGAPDILEEARVGIDWLLRCNFAKDKFVTQVQDLSDHDVGWRLPEEDTLKYIRKGYMGMGKNLVGIYSAVMALASRIWTERFYDSEFGSKLLNKAKEVYALRNKVPDVDKSPSGFYQDVHYEGKLALGAIELYLATRDKKYLDEAETLADKAGSDYWWSWGNINSLAHYRIAKIEPRFADYIKNNLDSFNKTKSTSVFCEGLPASWGTTNSYLGIALQVILYKDLTGVSFYDSLAVLHRDYVLGRNPWGISFIYNIGTRFPVNLHSQVAYFNNGRLPGAITAGPAPSDLLSKYNIERQNFTYDSFNTASIKYFDDKMDYITNEPTIVSNATGLFVFAYYAEKR